MARKSNISHVKRHRIAQFGSLFTLIAGLTLGGTAMAGPLSAASPITEQAAASNLERIGDSSDHLIEVGNVRGFHRFRAHRFRGSHGRRFDRFHSPRFDTFRGRGFNKFKRSRIGKFGGFRRHRFGRFH